MKRFFDLIVSIPVFIVFLPLIAITALLVRIKLGSPIIFKQKRPGLHRIPFYMYKFRTMTDERDESNQLLSDHIRLTPFGKFLRKCSLDELPQLWNVIKGDISLVGPRPLLMEYLPLYNDEQVRRHLVKPGITGWAQVNGRNTISWEDKFRLDIWYVDHYSFWLDLKILVLTLLKVVKSEGISNSNHVTMPLFQGTAKKEEGSRG
ncbi:sugar transferase [Paenibacillus sp. BR2-3]|uniref:sugar transferase n=1 Tax=Paenibacillus sp. BR2-3 TaxID=3048494 RepID=UPI003977DA7C